MPRTLAKPEAVTVAEKPHPENEMSKKPRARSAGNLFLRLINPSMWFTPHPLEFTDEFDSREFCLEKGFRLLLEPLEFKTEKEWLEYAREVWDWAEAQELRRKQALVSDFIASHQDDEDILKMLRDQVEAIAA